MNCGKVLCHKCEDTTSCVTLDDEEWPELKIAGPTATSTSAKDWWQAREDGEWEANQGRPSGARAEPNSSEVKNKSEEEGADLFDAQGRKGDEGH